MLGIFKSGDPEKRARAIVHAVAHFRDGKKLAEVSYGCASVMMMMWIIVMMMMIINCVMVMIAVVLMLHLLSIHMMIKTISV